MSDLNEELMDDDSNDKEIEDEELESEESDEVDDENEEESGDEEDEENIEESEEKNEKEYEEKVNALKGLIEENKFTYQYYVDIIELSRSFGDFDTLRTYREKMSELFPLTEKLWLDWVQDEMKYVTNSEDRQKVIDLFERAVKDYLSINIWVEYIQFTIGGLSEENGMEKVRSVCEKAIKIAGYHVSNGYTIWETYREFENAILAGLQDSLAGTTNAKSIEDSIAAQVTRIEKIFKAQIKISLDQMESTFEEFKQFDASRIDEQCIKDYETSLARLKELEPYEDTLTNAKSPEEKLEAYKKYIEFELSSDKENSPIEPRITCLFERAIADGSNCLDASLWLMYTEYLNEKCKNGEDRNTLIETYQRGLRNCPWISKLWINYALNLEFTHAPPEQIKKAFNDGMNAGLQTSVDYLELWHAYLDFLRRQIDFSNEVKNSGEDEKIESLRETFQFAINQLYQFFKHDGDPTFSLEKYWAYVEARYFKNMEQSRKIWNEMIIQKGMGKSGQEWIEFYEFENQFGDDKHKRKLLMRSLNEALDMQDVLCEMYRKFEKQNGTVETIIAANRKIDVVMKKFNAIKEAEVAKKKPQPQQKNDKKQVKKKDEPKKQAPQQEQAKPSIKRKKSEEEVQPKPVTEKAKESIKDSDGFLIPSLPGMMAPPQAKKAKGEDVNKPEIVQPSYSESSKGVSNSSVFISNLAYDVKQADIEEAFKKAKGYQQVRLVKHWSGKTRGYGYVDFDNQTNAINALKLDRTPINGRPMFVSPCEDKTLNFGKQSFKYATNLEKNKLFIANLPFSYTKEQLEEVFKNFGKLKEVRIVTYRSGKSKGLAYVEYEDEQSASKALLQTDNMLIGDNQISVSISNPPKRIAPGLEEKQAQNEAIKHSLGAGTVQAGTKTRAKGQAISMTPRAVVTKAATKTGDVEQEASNELKNIQLDDKKPQMSNADFRSLLLSKK